MKINVPGTDVKKNVQLVWPEKYISSAQIKCRNIIWYQNLSSYGSFHLLFDSICDPINVPSNYVPRTEKVKKSPDASCQTIFTMPLICDCQTKHDIAEWVCDVGKTLLMWLWLVRMVDEDLDVAALEPERETLRSRRRRAAYADVMDELDNMVSDIDDK